MYQFLSKTYIFPKKLSFLPTVMTTKATLPLLSVHRKHKIYTCENTRDYKTKKEPVRKSSSNAHINSLSSSKRKPANLDNPRKNTENKTYSLKHFEIKRSKNSFHASILLTYKNKYKKR
jgi:hypothetical protein